MMTATPKVANPDDLGHIETLLTHFEQLEAQFKQLRETLTHSHRLATLGTIATIIAHEYNNILTPVISYAQLALAKPDDHELMRKAVERALAGAERAAHISASMLGFARESDDALTAKLPDVVHETIACLARDPQKDGIELIIDVPDTVVAISPLNLQQVLLNLFLNAKRAMRRTGGTLAIRGRIEGDDLLVDVADSGPGIPDQLIDKIFEPFVTQCGQTTQDSEEPKGTGLGLCICRDLIRAAGGQIEVDTNTSQGATFHIRLPLADQMFDST